MLERLISAVIAIMVMTAQLASADEPLRTCQEIKGTDYYSEEERSYYLNSCLSTVPFDDSILGIIRACESNGNYSVINGYHTHFGAYQFDLQTWRSVGGTGYPHEATPQEQDYRAQLLYEQRGLYPWFNCARKHGLL